MFNKKKKSKQVALKIEMSSNERVSGTILIPVKRLRKIQSLYLKVINEKYKNERHDAGNTTDK